MAAVPILARAAVHPLHPALVHFPVAFWIGASVSELVCFMVSLAWRTVAPPPPGALAFSFAGSALVLAGAFCGGKLVYLLRVGVLWRAPAVE